jgi:predicted nicotinamide N-methyase
MAHSHDPIKYRYPITEQTVQLTARQLKMALVKEPNQLIEALDADDWQRAFCFPYWAYLWPSSIGLANYLDGAGSLANRQILEIGCGLGLAGIVGCQQGGAVLFTDYQRDALRFARYNAWRNGCADRATFAQMDWNAPCLKRKFSRILASDVIYEEKHWQPILSLIQTYLTAEGEAIFSEPSRANAFGFLDLLQPYGLTYQQHVEIICLEGRASRVSIYCVKRDFESGDGTKNCGLPIEEGKRET